MEVDEEGRRLKLTAERPRSLPRVDYSWYINDGEEIEAQEPRDYINYSFEEGRGLQPRGRGQKGVLRLEEQGEALFNLDSRGETKE